MKHKMYGKHNNLMLVQKYYRYCYALWLYEARCIDNIFSRRKKYFPRGYSQRYTIRISDYIIITVGEIE